MALVVDVLNMANWQRGAKGARPKPIERPGVTPPQGRSSDQMGTARLSLDEMRIKQARWAGIPEEVVINGD